MRWPVGEDPIPGDMRFVKKYAWLPVFIDYPSRMYVWREYYYKVQKYNFLGMWRTQTRSLVVDENARIHGEFYKRNIISK